MEYIKNLILQLFGRNLSGECSTRLCEFAPPTVQYCEKATDGLIARPWYALSNFFYIFMGIFIILQDKKSIVAKIFGTLAIIIGTCSMIYDITYTFAAQFLDMLGVFIFASTCVVLNMRRVWGFKIRKLVLLNFIFIVTYALSIIFTFGVIDKILLGIIFIAVIILEFLAIQKKKINLKFLILGVVLFLLGYSFWAIDVFKLWCDPNNILNGRSIYHLITAFSIFYFYKHYRQIESELS